MDGVDAKSKGSSAEHIISITETATCRYELLIGVPALCSHTDFAPKLSTIHEIQCFMDIDENSISKESFRSVSKSNSEADVSIDGKILSEQSKTL
jgi:hypothetical protein